MNQKSINEEIKTRLTLRELANIQCRIFVFQSAI